MGLANCPTVCGSPGNERTTRSLRRTIWREQQVDGLAMGAALCAVPVSIAVSESFLAVALAWRIVRIVRGRACLDLPRVFWFWLGWAVLEILSWSRSPQVRVGMGEMRHLLLLTALFVALPALRHPGYRLAVWRGIFMTASLGSVGLVVGFAARMIQYGHEISLGGDPAFYLRNGGLLHHWMIYSTVEIMVFGALLEFRAAYPEERRWITPALGIQCLAIFLSLTRTLWLGCLLLLGMHLIWQRSKWIWLLPAIPVAAFLLAPAPVRHRVIESSQPAYYSNAERLQMWRVGWQMIGQRPAFGIARGASKDSIRTICQGASPCPPTMDTCTTMPFNWLLSLASPY